MDLVVNNPSTNAVTVLLGNGNGTFHNPLSFSAGQNPGAPSAVDLNGDGIPDLIIPDTGANNLYVLLGNGDGTFAVAPPVPISTSGVPNLISGDLNGDGTPDVVFLTTDRSATVLLDQPLIGTVTVPVVSTPSALATHFVVNAPATATAGAAFALTITAEDSSNKTATSYGGTVLLTSTDAQATLPINLTLNNGVGIFSGTLKTAGSQVLTAADMALGSIGGVSGAITLSPAAATHFVVSLPPSGITAARHSTLS